MRRTLILLTLLVASATQYGYAQGEEKPVAQEGTTLELGKPIDAEFTKDGERKHLFIVALPDGQYAKVVVEQRGIDVAARLVSEDGKIQIDNNSDPRISGEETLEFVSTGSGTSTIAVVAKQTNAAGRFRIRLETTRSATEKDGALDNARRLNYQATTLWLDTKYDDALPLAKEALAIRKKELIPNALDIAVSLTTLANIYSDQGNYANAEALYQDAIAIREKVVGKDDISLSSVLNNFGLLYMLKGDYVKADELFRRVLEIRQKNLDPNHYLIANILNNIATIKRKVGDNEKATEFYKRSLKIRENALPPNDPVIATSLMNVANGYTDIPTADPLYRRAIDIREKAYGPDSPYVAETVYDLATLYTEAGDDVTAEPLAKRALSIFEKSSGPEHPMTAYALDLLANIYKTSGDDPKAEILFKRAIAIKEKTQGLYHPDLAETYSSLSQVLLAKNDIDQAVSAQSRGNEINELNLELNLAIGSESDKFKYLKTLDGYLDRTLRVNLQFAPASSSAQDQAAEMILRRKGRVLDAMADNVSSLRRRSNVEDKALLDKLDFVNKQLADSILNSEGSSDEYKARLDALTGERDKLEDEISRRASGYFEKTRSVNLPEIRSLIPADAALIEFAIYDALTNRSLANIAKPPTEPHYAVYIIRDHGSAKGIDLGSVKQIDDAVDKLRGALRDPARKDAKQLARTLDEKIMKPVRANVGDVKRLLISPDGQLNLIPFEALVDEKGSYLVESYAFSYLTSGRDLLRLQMPQPSKSGTLLIANPLFGGLASGTDNRVGRSERKAVPATRGLNDTYFAQLAGTVQEARTIKSLYPDAQVLTGELATEGALESVNAPRILHIATHGFFLEDTELAESPTGFQKRNAKIEAGPENPLLRSGLALAGANRHKPGGDDGILTALEASGMNLWGTKLVVLSACDTGLGEVRNGSGVFGLRRSFVLAGAETLVMSLWSVSDLTTRQLMTGYYTNLKSGMGRGAALREIQLKILKTKGHEHPFYWAAFIQSGEWADLDGKR